MAPAPSWFKILTWLWQDGDQSAKRKHIFILPLVPNTLATLKTSVISAQLLSLPAYLLPHSLPQEPQSGSQAQQCTPVPVGHLPRKPGLLRRLNCLCYPPPYPSVLYLEQKAVARPQAPASADKQAGHSGKGSDRY